MSEKEFGNTKIKLQFKSGCNEAINDFESVKIDSNEFSAFCKQNLKTKTKPKPKILKRLHR